MTISADKVSNLISSKDMKYDENVYLEISINKNNLAKLALSLIIKIFKNCISLIVELNEASKDHKNFKNKDYREHIRSIIVSLILII